MQPVNSMIEIHNHMGTQEMMRAILQSKKIWCRSGYSTIMDLYGLEKNVIMVPTPGQSEQEYLAEYLDGKFGFRKARKNKLIDSGNEEY
jgi:UDP-N-acetylglucosamine:LPS N-acetylglucosamine transferase